MASSRSWNPPDPEAAAGRALEGLAPDARAAVALSGGVDSVVLLHAAARVRGPSVALSAIHVHHGLSPNADGWAAFCAEICRDLDIPLTVERAGVARRRGESLEATAREARYRVLAGAGADWVLLAHHRDDQAETVLLQLLRGAGVAGLAAMGASGELPAGGTGNSPGLLRPFLDLPRTAIEAYARARGLRWIEDESNAGTAFDRNFLRHDILPRLRERFPGSGAALARSAAHLAEAAGLLNALAEIDAGDGMRDGRLDVAALACLDDARARNVLRWYLGARGVAPPSSARLVEILKQLRGAREDACPRIAVDGGWVVRYRGQVDVAPAATGPGEGEAVRWSGEPDLPFGAGRVVFERRDGEGASEARLAKEPVTLRPRMGGERLREGPGRPRRTLKNLFQERGVPPWQRERAPLLFCGEELVWVPGLGVDSGFLAAPGEPGWRIDWLPG